jgi:hypothetical protein
MLRSDGRPSRAARLVELLAECDRDRLLPGIGNLQVERLVSLVMDRHAPRTRVVDDRRLLKVAALFVAFVRSVKEVLGEPRVELSVEEQRVLDAVLARLAERAGVRN